jgi:hypothetical protein
LVQKESHFITAPAYVRMVRPNDNFAVGRVIASQPEDVACQTPVSKSIGTLAIACKNKDRGFLIFNALALETTRRNSSCLASFRGMCVMRRSQCGSRTGHSKNVVCVGLVGLIPALGKRPLPIPKSQTPQH